MNDVVEIDCSVVFRLRTISCDVVGTAKEKS